MKQPNALNILIVDDEKIVRETLIAMINHLGHSTEGVSDGLAGREVLKNRYYDAAFVDIGMPGLDGISLLKWTKQEQQQVLIIIITGHGVEDSRDEALRFGAFSFLKKPFSLKEIKRLINEITVNREKKNFSGDNLHPLQGTAL